MSPQTTAELIAFNFGRAYGASAVALALEASSPGDFPLFKLDPGEWAAMRRLGHARFRRFALAGDRARPSP